MAWVTLASRPWRRGKRSVMASLPGPPMAPAVAPDPAWHRRPTLRDVAALAGVSFKTVSRVVNGESGVSPAVADRVRAAADSIGYRPNAAATALRRADGRTATFGVLLEDSGNPFFASLLRGVEDVARERGVAVFASSTDLDLVRERDMASAFAARQVDALIAAPTESSADHLHRAIAQGLRIVLVDRPVEGLEAPAVLVDNVSGARAGVEHLLAQGHTRIGYIGRDPSIYTSRGRYAGYVEALTLAGIEVDPVLVRREGATRSSAQAQVEELLDLDDPPTALFTAQDLITMTAVSVLQRRGLAEQVALVGFDDFELADLLQPGVTVIAQDPRRIGAMAAELALDPRGRGVHLVPTRLIARGSGEIPARL